MNQEEVQHLADPNANQTASADALQTALRFLRVLRFRKTYVITTIFVAGLLGVINYSTATRIYESTASVLIQQNSDALNASTSPEASRELLMPTYEKLFTSPVVLDSALKKLAELPASARIDFADQTRDKWNTTIKANVTARRARQTNIIDLSYRSKSPAAAETVLDVVLQAYLEFMEKTHRDVSVEIANLLDVKLRQNQVELDKAQTELLRIKGEVGVVIRDHENYMHPIVQGVMEINRTRIESQKQRVELEATSETIRDAVAKKRDLRQYLLQLEPTVGRDMLASGLGLNPQFAEIAGTIEQQLMEQRAKLESRSAFLGPTHPEIIELQQNIANAGQYLTQYQVSLSNRLNAISDEQLAPMLIGMVDEKLAKTKAHEAQLDLAYKQSTMDARQLNNRLVQLQIAEDKVASLKSFQETLQDRLKSTDLLADRNNLQVNIVGEAIASDRPVWPRLKIVGIICLLGGTSVGCAIVYILDILDDRFRSPEELREQLRVPLLAMVRNLEVQAEGGRDALHVFVSPRSVESESFRTLRTTLAFSGHDSNRLAITSSEPGDGKTTILANMGVSYAQAGKRTLLIDADMRKPGLSKLFQMRGIGGMSEVLRSDEDLGTACMARIQQTGVENLDVLPCGPKPPNPVELLSDSRFTDLIAWAETHYDQVLIDCPPVMAAADAAIVGRIADGMLLVVQPAKNHRRLVIRATESLLNLQVNLLGIVANRVGDEKASGYGGYGYGYGYGFGYGYGYGYGHDDDVEESKLADTESDTEVENDLDVPGEQEEPARPTRSSKSVRPRRAA